MKICFLGERQLLDHPPPAEPGILHHSDKLLPFRGEEDQRRLSDFPELQASTTFLMNGNATSAGDGPSPNHIATLLALR